MRDADVIVIGAGLTGLRAALDLVRAGLSILVVEGEDSVGGRMRTTPHDGFLLDHGFQVILGGYSELATVPLFETLKMGAFDSGARIRQNGSFFDFFDVRRHPAQAAVMLKAPFFSLGDMWRLFKYAELFLQPHPKPTGEPTSESLRRYGFSERFISGFLRPFLSAVLLDPTLSIDSSAARFYLKSFSRGAALLPQQGVQALPNLLAQQVGVSHILLRSRVDAVRPREIVLQSGETLTCQRVLCCTDAYAAAQMGGPVQTMPHRDSRTIYFAADRPPFRERLIALNAEQRGVLCSVSVSSNVQPSYAPSGKSLVAATIVGEGASIDEGEARARALQELREWFGEEALSWRHLQTFTIPRSVPARPRMELGVQEHNGILFAGDYLTYGAQNGALRAGREAARLVAAEFETISPERAA